MIKRPLVLVLALATFAQAATIVNVTTAGTPSYVALGGSLARAAASSWTQSGAFTAVSVSAQVMTTDNLAVHQGTAWLTNSLGPGTTNANVIATTNFNFPVVPAATTAAALTTLFTGLSLGPGTYYLLLMGDAPNANSRGWQAAVGASVALGTGVSNGAIRIVDSIGSGTPDYGFLPDSTFANIAGTALVLYDVSGTAAVPEPGTLVTLGAALVGLFVIRGRRRRIPAPAS